MTNDSDRIRLAVIGAGVGGYPAAFLGADLGFEVTLIDPEPNPGGVCLFRGCIPSKALLHAAHLLTEAREAHEIGIAFGEPRVDLDRLREWKRQVVSKLTGGVGQIARARKVRYVRGRARFLDANTLRVANDGELTEVGFDHAVIATGSTPLVPPSLDIGSERVWTSDEALDLPEVPERLLVVGGGNIGLEMGQVYAALGSRVTVVEMTNSLLPGTDRDLVDVLRKRIESTFEAVHLNTRVAELEEDDGGVRAVLTGAEVEREEQTFDRVLVAVGRRPHTADLDLEQTKVTVDERGFIEVDAQRRTKEPSIFAVGDVVGHPMLAHKATHEARAAVEAMAGEPAVFDPAAVPAVVYTDPAIVTVGLTETLARERGIDIETSRFPWSASGRAISIARSEGFTKVIVEPGTERVLGMTIVGSGADELVGEATLAVEMGARLDDLRYTIHAHPTLGETLMEAADVFYGRSPHFMSRRR